MIKIGEKLQGEREKRGLTLEQVAKVTRIRTSFLEALENGAYEKLPGQSYAHGFVKNYLEFLGLPLKDNLAIFRREYDEKENRAVLPESFTSQNEIPLRRFSLRQVIWLGGLILLGLFVYLFFQYRAAFLPPLLTVDNPKEGQHVLSQTVLISGTTDQNTTISVEGLPAAVDQNGHFTKTIPVFSGNVVINVKAENSFGKVSMVERHITVIQ